MLIKKCDRCGVLIEFKNKSIGDIINNLLFKDPIEFNITKTQNGMNIDLDLCPNCSNDLKIWFTKTDPGN